MRRRRQPANRKPPELRRTEPPRDCAHCHPAPRGLLVPLKLWLPHVSLDGRIPPPPPLPFTSAKKPPSAVPAPWSAPLSRARSAQFSAPRLGRRSAPRPMPRRSKSNPNPPLPPLQSRRPKRTSPAAPMRERAPAATNVRPAPPAAKPRPDAARPTCSRGRRPRPVFQTCSRPSFLISSAGGPSKVASGTLPI